MGARRDKKKRRKERKGEPKKMVEKGKGMGKDQ